MNDFTSSNYGLLFDDEKCTPGQIRDSVDLNRFAGPLLSAFGDSELTSKDTVANLSDVFCILSISLEEHPDSHNLPNVDATAAAQSIHAGRVLLDECNKGRVNFKN